MRGRILSAAATLSFLAISACAPPPAPTTGTPADETAIRAIGPAYAAAWNKADIAALVNLSTEDFEGVDASGKVTKGRAGVEAEAKESAAQRAQLNLTLAIETSMVRFTSATSASTGGTWTVAGAPPGAGADKGAWSSTVIKGADGQWRMATALVAEFVPPPAAPPAAPEKGKGK